MRFLIIGLLTLAMYYKAAGSDVEYTIYPDVPTTVVCKYDFVVQSEIDGSMHHFSQDIEGVLQYSYQERGHKLMAVDFKKTLDLLPMLDRTLNYDIVIDVNAQYCKEKK